MLPREFIIFICCGGIASLANIGSRWLFSMWFPYDVAIAMAFVIGMLTAFVLFRNYVFTVGKNGNIAREIIYYLLVNAIALAQTMFISILLADYIFPELRMLWHKEDIAHIIGVGVPVITSYIGHKYWTFRKKKAS